MKKETKKTLLQLPATIEAISSRADGTWAIRVGTQELDKEDGSALMELNRKLGWFMFKEDVFEEADLLNIPEVKPEFKTDKTPSQRLRAVLYVLWEQKYKKSEPTFENFYRKQTEKIINWVKEKLE